MIQKIKILLLTCGTNACFHISKIIKANFSDKIFLVGTDINDCYLVPNINLLDSFYKCPYSNDESYYNFILNICKREKINFIIPSFDYDQILFYPENKDLIELGVKSLSTPLKTLQVYKNKKLMNDFLLKNGIKIPRIYSHSEIEDEHNYILKPINGVGSIGVKMLSGKDIKLIDNLDVFLIEEICSGPEITTECFLYKKQLYSISRERIQSKAGVCTKTYISSRPELNNIAYNFSKLLNLPYIFNLQFMKNSDEEYVVTDVNLRTAGGMSLSYSSGWDEVSALMSILLGYDDSVITNYVNHFIVPQYIVRTFTDIVTKKISNRIAFDFDGTLLDSKQRHIDVMDFVLNKNGLTIDTNDLVNFKASGKNNIDWLIKNGIPFEIAKRINTQWIELIENFNFMLADKLYDYTIPLLLSLKDKNDLFLITARNNESNLYKQIEKLGLNSYFKSVKVVKSTTNSYIEKSQFLVDNDIDVMIGDTEVDLFSSNLAKCDFYAVQEGFRSIDFLKKFNVKFLNISEILKSGDILR